MDKKEFRKDINSLRAIAVISVILFHFFQNIDEDYSFTIPFLSNYFSFSIFQAGYLGVDIFFVVSGFLMTKIIITGLDKNSFSIGKFGKARAKRICPALFFMLCFFGIFSYILFSSSQITDYIRQTQGALLFLSNLRFASRVDYFAENDLLSNVLLHCGSLSVEGQFYIFYPFLLIVISKYFKNGRLKILSLLFVLSFITSLILSPNSAYYYLQARAGELLAGGIVFLVPKIKWQGLDKISLTIFILFVLVICFSPKNGNSFSALLIVLLTSLVIYINKKDSFLFNSNIVQYLGKISYSLYLYHGPVVCLYSSLYLFSFLGFIVSLVLIFMLASISYCFCERTRSYGWIFLTVYILLSVFATVEASEKGTLIKEKTIGFVGNVYIKEYEKNDIQKIEQNKNIEFYGNTLKKESKVLLVGDSNARHYATFVFKNYDSFYSLVMSASFAYSTSLGQDALTEEEKNCYLNDFVSFLNKNDGANIFLSNRGTRYFLENNKGENRQKTLNDVDYELGKIIRENQDDHFIVIGVTPIIPRFILNNLELQSNLRMFNFLLQKGEQSYFDEKKEWRLLDNYLKKYFANFSNVNYVSPLDIMCKNEKCKIYDNEGNLLFFDITHFSKYGSNFIEPYLLEAYEKANDKR